MNGFVQGRLKDPQDTPCVQPDRLFGKAGRSRRGVDKPTICRPVPACYLAVRSPTKNNKESENRLSKAIEVMEWCNG